MKAFISAENLYYKIECDANTTRYLMEILIYSNSPSAEKQIPKIYFNIFELLNIIYEWFGFYRNRSYS